jgi:hypothetical protein
MFFNIKMAKFYSIWRIYTARHKCTRGHVPRHIIMLVWKILKPMTTCHGTKICLAKVESRDRWRRTRCQHGQRWPMTSHQTSETTSARWVPITMVTHDVRDYLTCTLWWISVSLGKLHDLSTSSSVAGVAFLILIICLNLARKLEIKNWWST